MNIKKKLIGGSLLTVLVPVLAMLVLNTSQIKSAIHTSYEDKVKSDVFRIIEQTIPEMMRKTMNYISFLSTDANLVKASYYAISIGSSANIQKQLGKFNDKLKLSFMEISDPNGKIIHSTMKERIGRDRSGDGFFATVKEKGSHIRFFFNKDTGEFNIDAAEVIIRKKKRIGIVYGGYWFKTALLATLSKDSIVAFYAPDSVTKIATEPFDPGSGVVSGIFKQVDLACQANVSSKACTSLQIHFSTINRKDTEYIVATAPMRIASDLPSGTLVMAQNAGQMARDVASARQTALIVATIFVVLAISFAFFIAQQIIIPIRHLSGTLVAIVENGDFSKRVNYVGKDEVGQAVGAVNIFLVNIQHALLEINDVMQAAADGDFKRRITLELKGDLDRLKGNINSQMKSLETALSDIGETMQEAVNGDFKKRVTVKLKGDLNQVKGNVNGLMVSLEAAIDDINESMQEAANGNFKRLVSVNLKGDLDLLKNNVNSQLSTLDMAIANIVSVARDMAKGDLRRQVTVDLRGSLDDLKGHLNHMIRNISDVVRNVATASTEVVDGSQKVNESATQIAEGATEQSASLEQTSTAMDEMNANIQNNADNAQQTGSIAIQSAKNAQSSGDSVEQTAQAMKKIASKIKIIQEISEQTNLLALNAAIEAARAGDHGKGFAVVADEVRKLAERSQKAATEINAISTSSVKIAEQTETMLAKLVPDIQRTSELVQEIQVASQEQSQGTAQINQAIQQLSQVVGRNAEAAEDMGSMASTLAEQADHMQKTMDFFKIQEQGEAESKTEQGPLDMESMAATLLQMQRTIADLRSKEQTAPVFQGQPPQRTAKPHQLSARQRGLNLDMIPRQDGDDSEFERY